MATEVEISTAIDTAQAQQGLTSLRKGLKELISLQEQVGKGTTNYHKLQRAINETEGRIGDLTDSFTTLRGSGVERVNASLNIFREGLLNADTEKLKIGLQGLGAAMKAIPIFLLVEGISLLIQNFDKLSEAFSVSAQQAKSNERALKDLSFQIDAQRVSLDSILISKEAELKALKDQGAGLADVIAKLREINGLKQGAISGEIGKLDKEMQNVISTIQNLKNEIQITDLLPEFLGGDSTDKKIEELTRKLEELQIKRGNLTNQRLAQETNTEQAIVDEQNKAQKEALERQKEYEEKRKRLLEERFDHRRERLADEEAEYQKMLASQLHSEDDTLDLIAALKQADRELEEYNETTFRERLRAKKRRLLDNEIAEERAHLQLTNAEKIAAIEKQRDVELENTQLTVDQRIAIIKKAEADILVIKTAAIQNDIALTQQYVQVVSTLNDLVNQNQLQQLRELESEKDINVIEGQQRAEQQIAHEEEAANRALANQNLTEKQRANIRAQSANKIAKIEYEQKLNQINLENDFNKKQLKIKKDQFEKEKALKLVNIAIDTASALVKTTAQLGGVGAITPAGIAMLAGITALGIAQAAVVANQKFDDSGFSAQPPPPPPVFSSGASPSGDRTPESAERQFNPEARSNVSNQGRRVVLLESDVREVADKVEVLESRASY